MFANAQLYSITPAVTDAWRSLLAWVIAEAGVDCEILDYPTAQPLAPMWERPDMGCAFMCGYPFALASPQPTLLAVPTPNPPDYAGTPIYWTDLVVRADSSYTQLTDLFGRRFAYISEDSQSGYQVPRNLFAPYAKERRGRLFAAVVGPLFTQRGVVDAVLDGRADCGPIDSYSHELLRAHEPQLAAKLRVLASTRPVPIPPMVAAADIDPDTAAALRRALLATGDASDLSQELHDLRLNGFVVVTPHRYDVLAACARAADALGYLRLA